MTPEPGYMAALNAYFDTIYVITLERATDRHAHIENELRGLRYRLFFGMDKQDFDVEALKREGIYNEEAAVRNHRYHKTMVPGMIGCSWSHRNVYEDMIANSISRALVLEDDVQIDREAAAALPKVLSELPMDWELFYLGYDRYEVPTPFSPFKKLIYHLQRIFGTHKFSHATINNLYPKKVTEHIFTAGYHDHSHAYALTLEGARKLRALQEPIAFIADNLLAHAATNRIVRGYIARPKLIYQLSQDHISMSSSIGD